MTKLTFLGTGSMVPTKKRNHYSILLSHKDENILIDCGEGTQRQIRIKGLKATKITRMLISHWHGDHVLGVPGILLTMGASDYNKTLFIYGPRGSKRYFKSMFEGIANRLNIKVRIEEIIKDGKFLETNNFTIEAYKLEHDCPTLGFRFIERDRRNIDIKYLEKFGLKKHPVLKDLQSGKDIEWKGKKISASKATKLNKGKIVSFISDTVICNGAVKIAKDADVLVSESTHLEKDKNKEYRHMTARCAGTIAKKAKVGKLVLTHFSQRYKKPDELVKEAKGVFKGLIVAAEDFDEINV